MTTLAREFARFFNRIRFEDLPAPVVMHAKKSILDLIGVAIGGLEMPFPQMVVDYLVSLGGKPEATLLGTPADLKLPALHTALGNGICGHALDMDDGYRFGGVHPGVSTIPAAIAAGEVHRADGKALILGTVLGSEIINRLAKAMNPSHLNRGFHTTGTLGPFGAAAAAGKIYNLDETQFARAFGLAGLQAAGLLEILHDGAMSKPVHPGKAAMAGIFSVELARRGARGPETILEGKKGFFTAMADEVDQEELLQDLGERYFILEQYTKLHAACRHVHPAIDAMLQLKKEHKIAFDAIESVHVSTYPIAISFCGSDPCPQTGEAAKFSLPFSIAMAAFFEDAGMDRFVEETVQNKEIQALAARVTASSEEKWEREYPDKRGASVEITTKDGKKFWMDVPLPKGEPENPPTQEELISKFSSNAAKMPAEARDKLISVIMELENHTVSDLTDHFHF
ncbi:MAG: MmgE/PrpD family protein [Deltaproteobacteria bacterium]|nr:MmgE/PrpD family protein [Deltaproteobacteria bacterium]MBW2150490.1 MmgE/PrpD family protein [Deltaproteobacteria bacterium]